ncbi:uncharacterized protein F4822DRAFT_279551 [Hypoxylon trugodes]|uniref:uncharacterized protein n=1 Tax=Hypoxylon trugodes TaxID=326681 RepID=UPI0021A24A7F|nr:uncharacterized protein F4822DRAFT_279551 [Hypoxylon trugodes]KAI1387337.1 hypothetical protein F4822DRAFT_279551 [Hypoxylon trugodes]
MCLGLTRSNLVIAILVARPSEPCYSLLSRDQKVAGWDEAQTENDCISRSKLGCSRIVWADLILDNQLADNRDDRREEAGC